MSDVDDAIAAAHASWSRISAPRAPVPRRRGPGPGRRLLRMAAALVAILVAAGIVTAILGTITAAGALLVMLLLLGAVTALALWPAEPAVLPPDRLRTADLPALPEQTLRWLRAQRPALPAPAQHLLDRIGDRLDTLAPQLGRLPSDGEQALEVRRLIGEQLPAFVADYARVPEPLRRVERGDRTPDAALTDGLSVIEREIAALTARLAQDDVDSLQTRGRYLETRYPGGTSA